MSLLFFLTRCCIKVSRSLFLFVHPSFSPYTMSHLAVYGGAGALGRALVTYFKERGFVSTTPT